MASWNSFRGFVLLFCVLFAVGGEASGIRPPLYTGDFGDCLPESSFTVAHFDAAYDAGNKTVVFHLNGTSSIEHKRVILRLSIDGYGINRFDMTFDPCGLHIPSLCPLSSQTPITASTVLPAGNHPISQPLQFPFHLPDYEGTAKLQVYAASDKTTEIGCFQASLTNGHTVSHPAILAPILGFFTLVAMAASFLTAIYGISVPHMRMHHAHSLSVMVVLETFQSIFFSGALSVDWPPILTAWWSNFAWSAGMIYAPGLVQPISVFTGVDDGIGTATTSNTWLAHSVLEKVVSHKASKGTAVKGPAFNSTFFNDTTWSGNPVKPGLPFPGTAAATGFPATLSVSNIPIADAFLLSLIWIVIAFGFVTFAIATFKAVLGTLVITHKIHEDRLFYFRNHWLGYLAHALQRTLVVFFFTIMALSMMQFTMRTSVGPIAIAAVVFILVLISTVALVVSGCRHRTKRGKLEVQADRVICYRTPWFGGRVQGVAFIRESTVKQHNVEIQQKQQVYNFPMFKIKHIDDIPERNTVHMDEVFVKRYGWLSARYRRTRWWFMAYHVGYLFCRAALLGGGWKTPHAQVYGILVVDILNFIIAAILNPFEGARNTVMGVWILGFSKIITGGIATTLLPGATTTRSTAASHGLAILVIQASTVVALLALIVLSTASSFLSLMRNRKEVEPEWLEPARIRYFTAIEKKARDAPFAVDHEPPPPTPRFSVLSVHRCPKIEDEDTDAQAQPQFQPGAQGQTPTANEQPQPPEDNSTTTEGQQQQLQVNHSHSHSRQSSSAPRLSTSSFGPRLSTGSLPRAARPYRMSWSSRDFRESVDLSRRASSVLIAAGRCSGSVSGVNTCVVVTDCDMPSSSLHDQPSSSYAPLSSDTPPSSSDAASSSSEASSVSERGRDKYDRPKPESGIWSLHTPSPSISRSSSPCSARQRVSKEIVGMDGKTPTTVLVEALEPVE
ncbi:hypothetical protein B0J18DRAFT_91678 [Chaetomium sp. MPI-SDFR-AT-0129]|nr:hypothetical protein B0J18DRAFT_91678 [Chaetomium sp. MPI-SDFR-AT-0129]